MVCWSQEITMAKSTQKSPETDAKGQFAKTQHGGDNDGVSSANPRVLSGKKDGDATFKSDAKENKKDRQAPSKSKREV
jgi:hypothetical protein